MLFIMMHVYDSVSMHVIYNNDKCHDDHKDSLLLIDDDDYDDDRWSWSHWSPDYAWLSCFKYRKVILKPSVQQDG
jgi:hypothetical protein